MDTVLNIVRSAPDEFETTLIDAFAARDGHSVVRLYDAEVDWSGLVDEIFKHDQVICWW